MNPPSRNIESKWKIKIKKTPTMEIGWIHLVEVISLKSTLFYHVNCSENKKLIVSWLVFPSSEYFFLFFIEFEFERRKWILEKTSLKTKYCLFFIIIFLFWEPNYCFHSFFMLEETYLIRHVIIYIFEPENLNIHIFPTNVSFPFLSIL